MMFTIYGRIKGDMMKLQKNDMFATPESLEALKDWIELHNGAELIHVATAAAMTANYILENYTLTPKKKGK